MIPELVATFTSGIFFGAALYINLVEQPARVSCGVPLAVTEWRPSYKRGTLMQASLALVGSVAALLAWWLQGGAGWLIGGSLFVLVVPFTLIVILPTNNRLETQDLDIRSEEAGRLLRRWGKLHAVRTILSGIAFLVFLSILIAKR
jgi:membrane protein YdbS with pleckstrin-like domain